MSERRASVVVTGAAQGIGAAISTALLDTGWAVVGVDASANKLASFAKGKSSFTAVVGDVRDETVLRAAVTAADALAPLSAWVNNAGVTFFEPLHLASRERIERTLTINLGGAIYGSRAAIASFMASGTAGVIVNISSIHGQGAFPGWSVYDATKGGIDALTRSICAEYGHLGIRCNAIAPGAVNTEIIASLIRESPSGAQSVLDEIEALAPMRRVIEPAEIAAAVAWLLSSGASAVNGQVLAVDGGALSRSMSFPPNPDLHF